MFVQTARTPLGACSDLHGPDHRWTPESYVVRTITFESNNGSYEVVTQTLA